MGKGIALTFKKHYPIMYKEYQRLCQTGKFNIGMLYIYRTPNKLIVNFPTKRHWRNPSKVEYITAGLEKFVNRYHDYGISSVSFPQLGCGHGELNWERQVQPIMEQYLKNLPIPVYIHLFRKSNDFVPERLDDDYAAKVGLERQRISSEQLWSDLMKLANGQIEKSYQLSLFNPTFHMTNEFILINSTSKEAVQIPVYREEVEDLWNILRVRGTLQENDIPEQIRQKGNGEWLMEILKQLPYIREVRLKASRNKQFIKGLIYDPDPEAKQNNDNDIII